MNNFIKQNIKYLRSENNLDQSEFGGVADASRDAVGSWEGGRALPKIDAIQKICAHFKITIDDFVNRDLRDVERGVATGGGLSHNAQVVAESKSYEMAMFVIEKLEAQLKDKDTIIEMQRQRIEELEGKPSKSKRQAG